MPKPTCPWCGGSSSAVYRSKWGRWANTPAGLEGYRRRRQCADCGRDWPTIEHLDEAQFTRDLAAHGLERIDGIIRAKP